MFSHDALTPITQKIIDRLRIDYFVPDDSKEVEALLKEGIQALPKPPIGNFVLTSLYYNIKKFRYKLEYYRDRSYISGLICRGLIIKVLCSCQNTDLLVL